MKVIPGKVRARNKAAFDEYAEAFNCAIDAFIQLDEVRVRASAFVLRCHSQIVDIYVATSRDTV